MSSIEANVIIKKEPGLASDHVIKTEIGDNNTITIKKELDHTHYTMDHIEVKQEATVYIKTEQIDSQYDEATHEVDIKEEPIEMPQSSVVYIKTEQLDSQYEDSSDCDGMQLKQESCDMSNINIKPTSSICNDVLNNINIKHINNIETVREHFKGECDYCNRIYGCRQSLVKHIDKHIAQQTCVACNILFSTSTEFIDHVVNAHKANSDEAKFNMKRPFVCNVCDKRFIQSRSLIGHQFLHTNIRPYVCEICNKSYTIRAHLKRHERTHTNERPFSCSMCDKTFTVKSHMKRHLRKHSNVRPYSCDVCDKTFTQISHLKVHRNTHTNERPYACDVCGKRFTQNFSCKRHQATHTNKRPFACDLCNKSFAESGNLKQHQRRHTGERPFACSLCGKCFRQGSDLKRHQITHTTERPYFCTVCDKSFRQSAGLKYHMRHTHAE